MNPKIIQWQITLFVQFKNLNSFYLSNIGEWVRIRFKTFMHINVLMRVLTPMEYLLKSVLSICRCTYDNSGIAGLICMKFGIGQF